MTKKVFSGTYASDAKVTKFSSNIISPWVTLAEKEVSFSAQEQNETYHSIIIPDYVSVLARTPSGMIPVVRQFRPSIESYTWELPAGLIDSDEQPQNIAIQELKEEAGVKVNAIYPTGKTIVDTGRLNNHIHMFYAECSEPIPGYQSEKRIETKFITPEELKKSIINSEFNHQIHIASLLMAKLFGFEWDR